MWCIHRSNRCFCLVQWTFNQLTCTFDKIIMIISASLGSDRRFLRHDMPLLVRSPHQCQNSRSKLQHNCKLGQQNSRNAIVFIRRSSSTYLARAILNHRQHQHNYEQQQLEGQFEQCVLSTQWDCGNRSRGRARSFQIKKQEMNLRNWHAQLGGCDDEGLLIML